MYLEKLANSMEQRHSWQADSPSASQKWDQNFHYSSPTDPYPVHTLTSNPV